jgi:hypothetical protein
MARLRAVAAPFDILALRHFDSISARIKSRHAFFLKML